MYNEYLKEELLFEYKGKNGGESRERIIQYCCASSILNLCLFNLFISSSRTFRLTPGIKLSNCLSDIPSAIAVIISSLNRSAVIFLRCYKLCIVTQHLGHCLLENFFSICICQNFPYRGISGIYLWNVRYWIHSYPTGKDDILSIFSNLYLICAAFHISDRISLFSQR